MRLLDLRLQLSTPDNQAIIVGRWAPAAGLGPHVYLRTLGRCHILGASLSCAVSFGRNEYQRLVESWAIGAVLEAVSALWTTFITLSWGQSTDGMNQDR
jgi:hypothetical protein